MIESMLFVTRFNFRFRSGSLVEISTLKVFFFQANLLTVRALLERNADVWSTDKDKQTALDVARSLNVTNKSAIVKALEAAADKTLVTGDHTPLSELCRERVQARKKKRCRKKKVYLEPDPSLPSTRGRRVDQKPVL